MFGPQTDLFSPQMRGWWQLSPMERSPGVLGRASGCGMSGHDARTRCDQDVLMGNPERTPGPAAGGWEILGEAMLGRTAPGHRAPGHRAPGRTAPGRTALGSTMPGSSAPGRPALGHTAPGHGTAGICNPTWGFAPPGCCSPRPCCTGSYNTGMRSARTCTSGMCSAGTHNARGAGHHDALHHLGGFSPLPPFQGKHLTGKEPRVRKRRGNPLIKAPNWALGDPAAFVPPPRAHRRAAATTTTRCGPPGAPSPCSSRGGSPSPGRGQADRRAHCGAAAPAGKGLTPLVLIGGGVCVTRNQNLL